MSLARPAASSPRPRAIARWLLVVALMVFMMVVVGGITRLTESGLSMTRWEPIAGTVPPLNEAQWQAEFDGYKATPEYRKINRGMSLGEFKGIFFWEYLHRLIGRTIGMVFALPLLWFWWRRAIPAGYGRRLLPLLALGGLQGAIGWWMVTSGLVDRPDVSHLRLATHLMAALFIYAGLIWTALDLFALARDSTARPARLPGIGILALALLAVQIMLGAFTAGLDAGYAYSSWPLMGDTLFPAGGWNAAASALANLVSNPIVVQFVHRWFAWVAAAGVLLLAYRARQAGATGAAHAISTAVALQIALGIATLLSGVAIPIAVAHQATAALLLAGVIAASHRLGHMAKSVAVS
ncbi:COX15/CtaA family protein [Sphingomonas solaris]|uniref:Heme A synthase n=1 Tax=Alterirhizorhabdus solaris TaxID=2529389 RepID=A0A558RBL3_9SPHN|nr:COX15/CtaA family protein [Sphingomonas solaris]TVV76847.1 heme A synthase [Sphingomonas solaris]